MHADHERRLCRLPHVLTVADAAIGLRVHVDEERGGMAGLGKPGKGKFREQDGFARRPVEFGELGVELAVAGVVVDGVHIKVGRERGEECLIRDVWFPKLYSGEKTRPSTPLSRLANDREAQAG